MIQIVLPHIMPRANLEACLASMDIANGSPVPLLIIDNSPGTDTARMTLPPGVEVEAHPGNLGVAASWNRGLARGADLTLIMSASIRCSRGLRTATDYIVETANQYGVELGSWDGRPDGSWNVGWKCVTFGRALVDRIGLFDEGFYPAYSEDRDYAHRAILAFGAVPWARADADAAGVTKTGDAMAWKAGAMGPNPPSHSMWDYYVSKWGVVDGVETYSTPFNIPGAALSYWPDPAPKIAAWKAPR